MKFDSNEFPLSGLAPIRKYKPGLNAQVELHGETVVRIADGKIVPIGANGVLALRNVTVNDVPYGSVRLTAATQANVLNATFTGDLRETHLSGSTQVQLIPGSPAKGEIRFDQIQFGTLYALLNSGSRTALPFNGSVQGAVTFAGPLEQLDRLHASLRLKQVEVTSSAPMQAEGSVKPGDLVFRNNGPIVLDAADGVATIRSFQIQGSDTALQVTGSIPYVQQKAMDLKLDGSIDLTNFQLFDPMCNRPGNPYCRIDCGHLVKQPSVDGTLELHDGSFFLKTFTNGLSAVNGTVKFDRDRATIEKLTAHSGGGELSLGGFVSFGVGGPLVYRLEANANNVRVRYAGGISLTGTSELRLAVPVKAACSPELSISRGRYSTKHGFGQLTGFACRSCSPHPVTKTIF